MKSWKENPGSKVVFYAIKDNGFYDWRLWKPVFNMLDEAPVERVYFST